MHRLTIVLTAPDHGTIESFHDTTSIVSKRYGVSPEGTTKAHEKDLLGDWATFTYEHDDKTLLTAVCALWEVRHPRCNTQLFHALTTQAVDSLLNPLGRTTQSKELAAHCTHLSKLGISSVGIIDFLRDTISDAHTFIRALENERDASRSPK